MWIQGPYFAGKYTDIQIFSSDVEPGERVEADKGSLDYPDKRKCPGNDSNPAENWAMQGRARGHHETLIRRLKTWGILSQVFRHHITMHGDVFWACGGW
jgi:hypothetical protein